ncbi:Putative Luciferase-type oxidoreductase [Vibrio nigripulchritudo MADA3029]|uniref:LLM class oxidoreductase n=1 Tax=Vibrio nigripulchritudo TaxID=28173 RepID=UPI0003B1BB85|nr:LLM class oxidoreductase [Vibrio nigripulchritudo]CCN45156.1 Putative Luciferase-type oxidoreductase [Vibrio nigripulchritudo MADA3020]CCN54494.1 Putative Luciferase-type oxidoreductase [Vibrio nigripulchritudo MADA3021]CCN57544.1 Putative Luciferase-type oxidoreductase [Vibrio nigripulchritudo MADA3029]
MNEAKTQHEFPPINQVYNSVFKAGKLSIGLVAPLESYPVGNEPSLTDHISRIQLAEQLGFSAIWLRDVPFNMPAFGDAGQIHDPFVYLGMLAGQTSHIALGVASIILPLRHPAHVAKAAASIDSLSEGRLLLGIASGDRPEEYPALNMSYPDRSARFRESFEYIREMATTNPRFSNQYGELTGAIDMLPKPAGYHLPMLVTGASQQDPDWLAQNGDGWMTYPRNVSVQAKIVKEWRERIFALGGSNKPAMQSLYIDLVDDPDMEPEPIHLGFRSGIHYLRSYLRSLEEIGINHVALNLRFNQASIPETLERISAELLPEFQA